MKYALMSDIHANLEALEACLVDSKKEGCTHYAFLGDYVGYCADPKACIDIVRAMKAPCVKGNHDEYCASNESLGDFNPRAAKLVEWTRNQLTEEDREWLIKLSYQETVENFTIVHGTLDTPERWQYVFDRVAAAASLAKQTTQICFFGHTHVPVAFMMDQMVRGGTYTKFRIEKDKRYFINVGSVGQPRDNNPKAAYVTYDLGTRLVELRRVDYDFEETRRKIRDAGLG